MKRYQLINWFIEQYRYTRYLEIGIDNPHNCHELVRCAHKVGVDPNIGKTTPPHYYRETSDKFFEHNTDTFDIVFVDGLHIGEQAQRDVEHSLQCLSENGTIIMHDCRPYNERVGGPQRVPGQSWYGTVWLAWATLRATRPDLDMHVVTDDCGLGVVRRGSQKVYAGPYQSYRDWADNQAEILQALSPTEALEYYSLRSVA